MTKKQWDALIEQVVKLKPYEWDRFSQFVDRKITSKRNSTPMPSLEEFNENISAFDLPNFDE